MAYCKFTFDDDFEWNGRSFHIEGSGSALGREYVHREDGYYVETEITDIESEAKEYHCYWNDNDNEFTEEEYSAFDKDKNMNRWFDDVLDEAADSAEWECD